MFTSLLPLLLPLIVFILLVRNGFKKKLLVASVVIGLIICIAYIVQGNSLESGMINGIINFLIWYIMLDAIYRIVSKFTKKETLLK